MIGVVCLEEGLLPVLSIQGLPNGPGYFHAGERLQDETGNACSPCDVCVHGMSETGAEYDGYVGSQGKNLPRQFDARYARHRLISDHEVEPVGVLLETIQSPAGVAARYHAIAKVVEQLSPHLYEGLFIVDKKDALVSGWDRTLIYLFFPDELGQIDRKGGAFSRGAVDGDGSRVTLDDA